VTTPPVGDDDNPYVFDTNQPPRRKPQDGADWESSIPDEIMDAAADAVIERGSGCLLRPVIWLFTLPFRLVWRIIEGLSD
jgi:hypothetical protein